MCNEAIKKEIKKAGVYQYQVAAKIGVSEMTLIRWMREELPEEKRQLVYEAIQSLKVG